MLKNKKLRYGVVAAIAATCVALVASPAMADPAAGTYKTLNGVGSDTIQDVMNGVATLDSDIGSYDATGSASIQTTATGTSFPRPVGSGNGVKALSASVDGIASTKWQTIDVTDQIDFARSSSGPSIAGTDLTFIPFAKDAVTFAVSAASDFPRDIPLGSAAQDTVSPAPLSLRNIYRCTYTTFTDVGGDDVTIRPLLPQTGSGTRSFWLGQLGLAEGTKGACVTDLSNSVIEHDGTYVTGPGDIVPFSIAQYVAQGNHSALPTAVTERRGSIVLGKVAGVSPLSFAAGTSPIMNSAFPVSRNVYNVVATSRLSDPKIAAAFVGASSATCNAAGVALIKKYGFASIGALCGNTTTYKSGFSY